MSRFTHSWRRFAAVGAVGAISLVAACADIDISSHYVASNPPPVAPGPNAVWYHVNFATGSSLIDADGRVVIHELVASMQNDPGEFATIIGKSDTVGSENDNMHLSHRRADAVRDAIIDSGNISPDHVETRWTGERRLDTATGEGVADAANRVVDVAVDEHRN